MMYSPLITTPPAQPRHVARLGASAAEGVRSLSPTPGTPRKTTPEKPVRGGACAEDAAAMEGSLQDKHPWGLEVKRTFIHYSSPVKTISVGTPPKTVPSNFAPQYVRVSDHRMLTRTPLLRHVSSTPSTGGDSGAGVTSSQAVDLSSAVGFGGGAGAGGRVVRLSDFLEPPSAALEQQVLELSGLFMPAVPPLPGAGSGFPPMAMPMLGAMPPLGSSQPCLMPGGFPEPLLPPGPLPNFVQFPPIVATTNAEDSSAAMPGGVGGSCSVPCTTCGQHCGGSCVAACCLAQASAPPTVSVAPAPYDWSPFNFMAGDASPSMHSGSSLGLPFSFGGSGIYDFKPTLTHEEALQPQGPFQAPQLLQAPSLQSLGDQGLFGCFHPSQTHPFPMPVLPPMSSPAASSAAPPPTFGGGPPAGPWAAAAAVCSSSVVSPDSVPLPVEAVHVQALPRRLCITADNFPEPSLGAASPAALPTVLPTALPPAALAAPTGGISLLPATWQQRHA